MPARVGKIARLPWKIREELNQRLLDGESAPKILPWLNGLDYVKRVVEEDFEGLHITDKNLSDWRLGGYEDWIKQRRSVERTSEMARYAMKLAKAGGGHLSEGASAILAGRILEVLEGLDQLLAATEELLELGPDELNKRMAVITAAVESLTLNVSRLRKGDQNAEVLKQNRLKLEQNAEELKRRREEFEIKFCNKVLDQARLNKVQEIAIAEIPNEEKINALRKEFFSDVDALEQSGDVKLPE